MAADSVFRWLNGAIIVGMEEPPEERQLEEKESRDYAKWAQSEDKFWGNMKRREGFGLVAMVLFILAWLLFDLPKHLTSQ